MVMSTDVDEGAKFEKQKKQCIGAFLTLLIITGSCATIYGLIIEQDEAIAYLQEEQPDLAEYAALIVPSAVSFLKSATPIFIFMIVAYEKYQLAEEKFRQTFLRIFIVRMFFIIILLVQTLLQGSDDPDEMSSLEAPTSCRETDVGIIYYATIVVDAVIDFTMTIGASLTRYLMRKGLGKGNKQVVEFLQAGEESNEGEVSKSGTLGHSTKTNVYDKGDEYKDEFPVITNLINIMYMQGLVWSGMPYSPVLPFLGATCLFVVVWAKKIQTLHLTPVPLNPMGVAKQENFFRSLLVVTLIICLIPFVYFLNNQVNCGPHCQVAENVDPDIADWDLDCAGVPPRETMSEFLTSGPAIVTIIVGYMGEPILLWVCIILILVAMSVESQKNLQDKEEIKYLKMRIRQEGQKERFLRQKEHSDVNRQARSGRTMFKQWMREPTVAQFARHYQEGFDVHGFADLNILFKLDSQHTRFSTAAKPQTKLDELLTLCDVHDEHDRDFFTVELRKKLRSTLK